MRCPLPRLPIMLSPSRSDFSQPDLHHSRNLHVDAPHGVRFNVVEPLATSHTYNTLQGPSKPIHPYILIEKPQTKRKCILLQVPKVRSAAPLASPPPVSHQWKANALGALLSTPKPKPPYLYHLSHCQILLAPIILLLPCPSYEICQRKSLRKAR